MSSSTIDESIRQIRDVISGCTTESVVGWCMSKHLQRASQIPDPSPPPDLSSPAKQMLFLLGLLVELDEPPKAHELDANDWQRVMGLLEKAFPVFAESFNPFHGTPAEQSRHWGTAQDISRIAFISYFYQTLLATVEQVASHIEAYLTPFDNEIEKDFGISPSDALDIARWIDDVLQTAVDELNEGDMQAISRLGKVSYTALIERFGAQAKVFWELFTIGRGQGRQLQYSNDISIVEERPLVRLSDDVAMCFSLEALFTSILVRSEKCVSRGSIRERYFRTRDKITEDLAESVFMTILGDKAKAYRNLYETPDNRNEHDLVILTKEICLVVEVKASPPREPFRDPEKAYTRLRREFRSDRGIQRAYDQALRLLKALRTKKKLVLYDRKGNQALRLYPEVADKMFCVSLTRDTYGPLATYLPFLLEKRQVDPYPWSINILDLENLAEAWNYLGWGARQLKVYVSQRIQFHTRMFSADELDYAGAFIHHCKLRHGIDDKAFVVLNPNYSEIFDQIHRHLHYGAPPPQINPTYPVSADIRESLQAGKPAIVGDLSGEPIVIGRNERCPCESGVKFKRCHGK